MSTGADSRLSAPTITLNYVSDPTPNSALTSETGEPIIDGTGRTAWWKFTPTADVLAVLDTDLMSSGDTTIAVFTVDEAGPTYTQVAYNDDDPNGDTYRSLLHFDATAGTTYWIQVDAYGSGLSYVLRLREGRWSDWQPALHHTFTIDGTGHVTWLVDESGQASALASATWSNEVRDSTWRSSSTEAFDDVRGAGADYGPPTQWGSTDRTSSATRQYDSGTDLHRWSLWTLWAWVRITTRETWRFFPTSDWPSEAVDLGIEYPDTIPTAASVAFTADTMTESGYRGDQQFLLYHHDANETSAWPSTMAGDPNVVQGSVLPLAATTATQRVFVIPEFVVEGVYPGAYAYANGDGWGQENISVVFTVSYDVPRHRYLYVGGTTHAPPLRQYPRSDGLGASSARRVWPVPKSVQASNRRVGGYL